MGVNGEEKIPYWLVVPLCTLTALAAGNAPESGGAYRYYAVMPGDRWTLWLPMIALSLLAVISHLIRAFGGDRAHASGKAWRVLTAGCVLSLLGDLFSWPLALAFHPRYGDLPVATCPDPFGALVSITIGFGFLGWSTFLMATARQRTWHSFLRHIGVAFGLVGVCILFGLVGR